MMRAPAPILPKPTGSIAGAANAQARAMTGLAAAAPASSSSHQVSLADAAPVPSSNPDPDPPAAEPSSQPSHEIPADVDALPPDSSTASNDPPPGPEPTLHQMAPSGQPSSAAVPLSLSEPPAAGPATLKTIRLSSNDPPLSVILELSGPVNFDKNLESSSDGSTATVMLKDVTPDPGLKTHLVFDRSIFKDCDISRSSAGTTVTLSMRPVNHFAVVPLDSPPRLLMTFTPQAGTLKTSSAK
jgi:hypothetical protein